MTSLEVCHWGRVLRLGSLELCCCYEQCCLKHSWPSIYVDMCFQFLGSTLSGEIFRGHIVVLFSHLRTCWMAFMLIVLFYIPAT